MKRHDRLTIFRNLHRLRELREFRGMVATWFERSERDVNDVPYDWEGAQAARSRINRMLPRVMQIVRAAGIGGYDAGAVTDPGPGLGRAELLEQIFTVHDPAHEQEIYDLLDMAIGVYESGRLAAAVRTLNPLHYAGTFLGFLAQAPRRMFLALGFGRSRSAIAAGELDRLEAAQARRNAEFSRQLAELAERLDFAERVLSQESPPKRLEARSESDVNTPV